MVLLAAVPLLLLGACGDDEPPKRVAPKDMDDNPSCTTDGTVDAKPAASLEAAVQAYREPGHSFRLTEKVSNTAEVQLGGEDGGLADVVVTLVRTKQGCVVTSVRRC